MKHTPTVFVVDDEEAVLSSLEAILTTHGYRVKCFTSAEQFLTAHDPSQIGCILIDLLMPGMNGQELVHRLRKSGSLLSVVIGSGLLDQEDLKAFTASLVPAIEKPYLVPTLLTMVEDGIAGSLKRRERSGRTP